VVILIVSDDLTTNINACVTNAGRGTGNKLFNVALGLTAETAAQFVIASSHCPGASKPRSEMAFSTTFLKAE
jgi:hypothetical protein